MPTLSEQINAYPLQVALAAQEDDRPCPCRGGGWILNPYDFWQECPVHHDGQPHPEAYQEGDFYEGGGEIPF